MSENKKTCPVHPQIPFLLLDKDGEKEFGFCEEEECMRWYDTKTGEPMNNK